jgi:superfamily I DNA/RNA helicase
MRQIQLRANEDKQKLTKKLAAKKKKNLMSFEVDYEFFVTHFWPNVNRKFYSSRSITPQLVWTEIYSTIKGCASSHLFPGQYLPEKAYISTTQNIFLSQHEKLDIYETFCQYERWKIQTGGYDIMDAVNYILNTIRFRGYFGPEIHYLMIDEVQDLPHAIIYLLSKTALHGVFYSGDTAQTIAKGVGFRFCDLKGLFDPVNMNYSLNLKKPIVKHLTVNFRSHNNILQLANSIVSSLEILFPKTIDKLAKERSDLEGPKPMILA